MAVMVEAPVVQTSSTMTTGAPFSKKPSMRRPVPWAFSALRTRKPWMSGARGYLLRVPGAGRGDVGDDGVGAHGESADGCGLELVVVDEIEDREAGEASALGVERGGAAVDVVVAGGSGGELEFAEFEGGSGEEGEQGLAVAGGHGW